MRKVKNGLDLFIALHESQIHSLIQGDVGLLCHSASLTYDLQFAPEILKQKLGARLKCLFSPQHGMVSDVQDNMVETEHSLHPYFKLPIYSLYSETRKPTAKMLEGLGTIIIDLQDIGSRVYTYISTVHYMLEACAQANIKVLILDRPNPIGGEVVEGNRLKQEFSSFVGIGPLPMRHGLTMGEFALWTKKHSKIDVELEVLKMEGWKREMSWPETGLRWINPSPNLSTWESALCFPGTVLFEGTNISEGRGSTRALEQIGHPEINPYELREDLRAKSLETLLKDFKLREVYFLPTFQKHHGKQCGGHFLHPLSLKAQSWRLGQALLFLYRKKLADKFQWKMDGYEYEYDHPAIDYINGDATLREMIDSTNSLDDFLMEIDQLEKKTLPDYLESRSSALLY